MVFHSEKKAAREQGAKEKVFMKQAASLFVMMLLCAGCMGLTAYAMFTHTAYTHSKLMAGATFQTDNAVSQVKILENEPKSKSPMLMNAGEDGAKHTPKDTLQKIEPSTEDQNRWEINEAGHYVLNIGAKKDEKQASTGFCLITITDRDNTGQERTRFFHSPQINSEDEAPFEVSLEVLSAGTVSIENNWGSFENYHFPEYNEALKSGDTIKIGFRHAEFMFDNKPAENVTVGERTFVQPAGSDLTVKADGQDVKVRKVKMGTSDGAKAHEAAFTGLFPVFDEGIVIRDYQEEGTGEAVVLDNSTSKMPEGLSVVKVETLLPEAPVMDFYDLEHTFAKAPSLKDQKLVFETKAVNTYCDAFAADVTYRYQDYAGGAFYYIIRCEAEAQEMSSRAVFAPGTKLTVTQTDDQGETVQAAKPVEEVKAGDVVQCYDFFAGAVSEKPVLLARKTEAHKSTLLNQYVLTFENGQKLTVFGHQNLFDMTDRKWVEFNGKTWKDFIGRPVMVKDAEGKIAALKIMQVDVTQVVSDSYELITAEDLNVFAEGVLVCDPSPFRLPDFKINEQLAVDQTELEKLIKEKGVYTYVVPSAETEEGIPVDEDAKAISEVISQETFEALRGQYFKITLTQQLLTKEQLLKELKGLQ